MGTVFSCLATGFMYLGEIMSTAFLAVGELGSVLSRGLFGLIVGICDVLAACMCCCRVPFEDRPDRDGYTYTTLAVVQPSPLLNLTTRQEVLMGSKDEKVREHHLNPASR